MPNPWEKYAATSGPWEKYGAQSTPESAAPEVIQEMPADFKGSRFAIKNFGGTDQDAIEYLKKEHPGYQYDIIGGQIAIKKPEDKAYKVLDPSSFELQDISDVGTDIASGIGSGIAAAGAGLGGTLTTGVGGLPAAMAAGGGSSAAMEYLRQKAGQALGVRKEVDPTQVALTGVVGGAAPFLFGTGASAAQQAARLAAPEGQALAKTLLQKIGPTISGELNPGQMEVAKRLLAQSQRGVAKFLPKVGESLSGASATTIQNAAKVASPQLQELVGVAGKPRTYLELSDVIQANGASPLITKISKDVGKKLYGVKEGLQERFTSALDDAGISVNANAYEAPLDEAISTIKGFAKQSDEDKAVIASINEVKDRLFYHDVKLPKYDLKTGQKIGETVVRRPIGNVGGQQAMQIKQYLKGYSDNFAKLEGKSVADKTRIAAVEKAYAQMGDEFGSFIGQADEALGGSGKLVKEYADHMELEREILPKFENPSQTYNVLRTLDGKSKQILKEQLTRMDSRYGTPAKEAADLLDVWSVFGDPATDAISGKGVVNTARSLGGAFVGYTAGQELGHAIGGTPGRIIGGAAGALAGSKLGSPAAIKMFLKASQAGKPFADIVRAANQSPSVVSQGVLNRLNMTPMAAPNAANIGTNTGFNLLRNVGK